MSESMLDILKSNNKRIDVVNKRLDNLKVLFNTIPEDMFTPTQDGFKLVNSIEATTVYQNSDVTVTLGTWKRKGAIWPEHCHKKITEYLIVTKGSALVSFGEATRIMMRGECASIPSEVKHSVVALEDNVQILGICIPPEIAYLTEGCKWQK